jgi:hypothetical protein
MARKKQDGTAPKKRGRPPKDKTKQADAPKAEAAPQEQSSAKGAMKLPAAGVIPSLIKRLEALAKDAGDITKGKRELIAKAEETKHVDKVALGWALSLLKKYKKKPAQFGVSFNHFLSYLDDLGLPKLADEAPARTGLSIVPGPNAPSDVPAAPDSEAA